MLERETDMDAGDTVAITRELANSANALSWRSLTDDARMVARQCLLDWIGVSIAARHEPLVEMLAATVAAEGGHDHATLIGRGARASVAQAALVNGAMGHALDYDDVIISMGHPTVPIAPVVLALAERDGRSGADLLTAFVAGVETEVRVARYMGPSHYARGFHGTATYGSFGAAAAAGSLLALDAGTMATAFGIAGTQAAGLKSMFGTMCKPLHAGKAAANGLLAATLAGRGFTSNPAVLETSQGFGATQSDAVNAEAARETPPGGFWIRQALFKYHAACYLTHSALNAAAAIRARAGFDLSSIEHVEIGVDPGHLKVCAIPAPATGLECKFSLAMTAAMTLSGENTADEALFSDDTARRPDLVMLREKVTVVPRAAASATLSDVTVRLADGRVLRAEHDVAVPAADLLAQGALLEDKFRALARPVLGERTEAVIAVVAELNQAPSIAPLARLIA